jgi:hypothetical protein
MSKFFNSAAFFCILTILFFGGISGVAFTYGEIGGGIATTAIAFIFLMMLPKASWQN